jgi:hypothetical protein
MNIYKRTRTFEITNHEGRNDVVIQTAFHTKVLRKPLWSSLQVVTYWRGFNRFDYSVRAKVIWDVADPVITVCLKIVVLFFLACLQARQQRLNNKQMLQVPQVLIIIYNKIIYVNFNNIIAFDSLKLFSK